MDQFSTGGTPRVVLICRRSPDWLALSHDYRAHGRVDPWRFTPEECVPGFPANIADLIDAWNGLCSIDYFTCRAVLVEASRASAASIPGAARADIHQLSLVLERARQSGSFAFFHDDDDVFAPSLATEVRGLAGSSADVAVFPLVRVAGDLFTFVREDMAVGQVLGPSVPFHFRFQTNNYGVNLARCDLDSLSRMSDHVLASAYADENGLQDVAVSRVVSATVKTPLSASMLPIALSSARSLEQQLEEFVEMARGKEWRRAPGWLAESVAPAVRMVSALRRGKGIEWITRRR